MTHLLTGGVVPVDGDLASASCDQLTCTKEEAATGVQPDDGQQIRTHEKEQKMSKNTIPQTTDNEKVPTSVDAINIVDNDDTEPGTYLTAWRAEGEDWVLTVDYIGDSGKWDVYGFMTDHNPITTATMTDLLAAHEDAKGIADHLNDAHPITPLLQVRKQQQDAFGEALLAAMNPKGN